VAVTAQSYLTLTNLVIQESGAELQELDASTFPTTTNPLHKRIKNWVKQAYIDIQLQEDWDWLRKDANLALYPRWRLTGLNAAAASAGHFFIGADTEAEITFVSEAAESGSLAAGTFVGYVNYTDPEGSFKLGEKVGLYDTDGTTVLTASAAQVTGYGAYNLRTLVSDLAVPFHDTFNYLTPATQTHSSAVADDLIDLVPLKYVPSLAEYNKAFGYFEESSGSGGYPQYIVDLGNGFYDLLPRPTSPLTLRFRYAVEPQELSAHGDLITNMPTEFNNVIAWRALMYYAKWAAKRNSYYYAKDRHQDLWMKMLQRHAPTISFAPNAYGRR
jgi:hypothetical protein